MNTNKVQGVWTLWYVAILTFTGSPLPDLFANVFLLTGALFLYRANERQNGEKGALFFKVKTK